MDDELRFHLDMLVADHLASGADEPTARARALREFGQVTRLKEECRDSWQVALLDGFLRDVRYAGRLLRRDIRATLLAVAALSLGIGLVATIFTVFHSYLLRGLPFAAPDRLYALERVGTAAGRTTLSVPFHDYHDYRNEQNVLQDLVALERRTVNLRVDRFPVRAMTYSVSGDFLRLLGVRPSLGSGFGPDDDRPGGRSVFLISHATWQREFGGDPAVVGRVAFIDGRPWTVAGVLPEDFALGLQADLWLPDQRDVVQEERDQGSGVTVIGRLPPGTPKAQAETQLRTLAERIAHDHPQERGRFESVRLVSYRRALLGEATIKQLWILQSFAGLVLLIGCANTANLLSARFTRRARELAIRGALGAAPWRIVGQIVVESGVLMLLGAAGGLGAAWIGAALLWRQIRPIAPRWVDGLTPGTETVFFVLALSAIGTVVIALGPAVRTFKADLSGRLNDGDRAATQADLSRLGRLFVVVQVSFALALVVATGLMLRAADRLGSLDLPYDPAAIHTARLTMRGAEFQNPERTLAFYRDLMVLLRERWGLQHVGVTDRFGTGAARLLAVRPEPSGADTAPIPVRRQRVSAGYFAALGVPVMQGREFTVTDTPTSQPVCVIDVALAELLWPGENPLGKLLRPAEEGAPWLTVVGVVPDLKLRGVTRLSGQPGYFRPITQDIDNTMSIVVRDLPARVLWERTIREAAFELAPEEAPKGIGTFQDEIDDAFRFSSLITRLLVAFGAAAVTLAAVGVYGAVSFTLAQLRRELGIRRALGAATGDVFRLIVGQYAWYLALGAGAGGVFAFLFARWLRGANLLANLAPHDPPSYLAALGLVALVMAVAVIVPTSMSCLASPRRLMSDP